MEDKIKLDLLKEIIDDLNEKIKNSRPVKTEAAFFKVETLLNITQDLRVKALNIKYPPVLTVEETVTNVPKGAFIVDPVTMIPK